jgi:hypothetical protein
MGQPFIGSEAVENGSLTKSDLRSRYTRVFRDVYASPGSELTPLLRAEAGWLWSRRRGVVAGFSAAALYRAKWVDPGWPAELIHDNRHRLPGLQVWGDRFESDELDRVGAIPVTRPARTALDLACWHPLAVSVAAIDALARATELKFADLELLSQRYPGRRGIRRARQAVNLADAGAESPKESWLRVILIRAGLPRPQTQIPVYDEAGNLLARLDMGWENLKVAAEYDGDHHRTDRAQFARDIKRIEMLERMGWIIIRVTSGDRSVEIVHRVRAALARRA